MRRLLILPTAAAVLLTTMVPVALADEAVVVHRESVLTELDPSGAPGTSRVFTQVTVPTGQKVTLPGQSTASLRSLTGAVARDGDDLVFGPGLSRTVADHTAASPVDVAVTYSIDGRTVEADEVVGHDGQVAVTYVVRNLTSEPTEVSVSDGDRVGSTATVDVAVPLVGSLSMTLPPAFRDVDAPGAVVVGDGRNNTVITWSLLLFAPLGSDTQEVTWTADARDAVVPEALLQVIPVSPASFGSFGSTAAAYDGAVDSTRELTAGARKIDRNLKALAEGAGKLLAGLTQLRDGSAALAEGLGGARDGSAELSAGLGKARTGAGELSSGLGDLANGADQLADGATAARDGSAELSDGLGDLSDGASRVAAGLAALDAGGQVLSSGLGQLSDGAGDLSSGVGQIAAGTSILDENTATLAAGAGDLAAGAALLEAGLKSLEAALLTPGEGIDKIKAGIPRLQGGLSNPACVIGDPGNPTKPCGITQLNNRVIELNGSVTGGLVGALAALNAIDASTVAAMPLADQERLATAMGTITAIQPAAGGVTSYAGGTTTVVGKLQLGLSNPGCDKTEPTDPLNPCGLLQGLEILEAGVEGGLGSATTPDTLLNGAARVTAGSAALADGAGRLRAEGTAPLAAGAAAAADGAAQLAAGAASADAGATQLSDGAGQLADGSAALADGATRAASGSQKLVDGLIRLDAGGGQLADGAELASDGSSELADGLVQLDDGGARLASGLGDAADGSQQLADGLTRATPGGQQIADGAQRLTDEGTSVLARSVSDASASSSLQLAHITAVAARGTDGDGLPYPTVDGAVASAVYKFELAGVGEDAGPGVVGRVGIGALALLVAALLGSVAGGRAGRRDEEVIDLEEYATV